MRRATPLLALLLLALPTAGADVAVDYPDSVGDTVRVDLIADAGSLLSWHLDTFEARQEGGCLAVAEGEDPVDARTATATLREDDGTEIVLSLDRNVEYGEHPEGNTVFSKTFPVDDARLVNGTYALELVVADGAGTEYDCSDGRELEVTSGDDKQSPVVEFPSAQDGSITLRAGQAVLVNVTDATLGRVEFRVDRMPSGYFARMDAPYIVSSQSFFPGTNELTVRATDRAGNPVTEETVTVVVDGDKPVIDVDLFNRTTFFAGTETPIEVSVQDASAYRITVTFQGKTLRDEGEPGNRTHALKVPANHTGQDTLRVRVADALGNIATFSQAITVESLRTDAVLARARQVGDDAIAGEDVDVEVTLRQDDGVVPVTFTLRLDGEELGEVEVPADGRVRTTLTTQLPPGRQTLLVQALAPEGVLSDEDDLTLEVDVEVFLARIFIDGEAYHVRVGPNGLPSEVVAPDGTTLPATLVQRDGSSVYAFETEGGTYAWDPQEGPEQTYTEPESTDEGEDSPGVGAVLLLALLGGLAVALRRRD